MEALPKDVVMFALSGILFATGLTGVIIRRNIILVFISVEIMLNAANLSFLGFAYRYGDIVPAGAALFVIALAVVEAAVGLALLVSLYRVRGTLAVDEINLLKR
ncbi:MAG: NADH-quinone oxidoreductase subunit NuoK [Spirochaetota bacterium]